MASVAVLGSINIDVVLRVARFPQPGETIAARDMARHPGGKGANQAVAAARAGAAVHLFGAVGDDADGESLRETLNRENVDCRSVDVRVDVPTGTAMIMVDDAGENQIVVTGGANLTVADVRPERAEVYLCQLETPIAAVAAFLSNRPAGSIGILNAAPFRSNATPAFASADIIVVNQSELAAYAGESAIPATFDEIAASARRLLTRDGQKIIVTLGKDGSLTISSGDAVPASAPAASVIDTTGAGDCFCGYLAAGLASGQPLPQVIAWAHRASAIAVGRAGAIPSIPFVGEVVPG